ncbi:hypothetical protein OG455_15945 [Kitasatospora sp. NBC_01287]|uniref:hypothetical protein n=1 Tax=Kitasatospora sp. NBC_01287 TaxID=2903573 RepID=UPI0022552804|nr:hypothetical protein [Kitasatospora sp. NBC_01287]MCX4747000.1 hypothetical protein [Kitasatospora sp. NBC_01287]
MTSSPSRRRSQRRLAHRLLVAGGVLTLLLSPAAAASAAPPRSDLEVIQLIPEPAPPGGLTTVHGFVANGGPDTTEAPFTVTITLPFGSYAETPFFPSDCRPSEGGHSVRCVFPAGLRPGRTATALIPTRIESNVEHPGRLTGGRVTVTGPDDPNPENNSQPFEIPIS